MKSPKIESKMLKKVGAVLGITLVLYFLLGQVEEQVVSRQNYESIAQKELIQSWGGNVKVFSPEFISDLEKKPRITSETRILVQSEERKKGVFRIPVYTASFTQKAIFEIQTGFREILVPFQPLLAVQEFKVHDEAGKALEADLTEKGLRFFLPPTVTSSELKVEIQITVRGSGKVQYESRIHQEKVVMSGNWIKPQFLDDHLPSQRSLGPSGFEAEWNLMKLSGNNLVGTKTIGMNHLWIATEYSMVLRSLKYGLLFVALTFLFVFLLEVMASIKIHPFQYGLVGLSLTLFYLLLLALSEVIDFNMSYLIATTMVIGLIAFYMLGFVKNKKHVLWSCLEQASLSGFFFVLLRLEERSLLVGSLGLFVVLATSMIMTRKIDWSKQEENL
jgi:inner membrane protein involved in colicin E2 resistance